MIGITQARYKLAALVALAGIEVVALALAAVSVAAYDPSLGQVTPYGPNSQPDNAHVFLLRKSKVQGVQDEIQLAAYYVNDPGESYLTISPSANTGASHVCSVYNDSNGALTTAEENRYISVTLEANGGGTSTYFISRNDACREKSGTNNQGVDATNAFYARYKIPGSIGSKDPQTGRYKVKITIALHPNIPKPASIGEEDIMQQRLVVRTDSGKIGPLGGGTRSFPIVVDWDRRDEYYQARTEIPFGLPCTATGDRAARIGVYDADNGDPPGPVTGFYPRTVKFTVFKKAEGANNWTRANLNTPNDQVISPIGTENIDGVTVDVAYPKDGTSEFASAGMVMQRGFVYKMVILGIAPRNTIDIQMPEDTIFGDINCGWEMAPTTSVFPLSQEPGRTVTFYHNNKNIGSFESDTLDTSTRWVTGGDRLVRTTDAGVVSISPGNTITGQTYSSGGPGRDIEVVFRIPAGAPVNSTFCQKTRSSLWKSSNLVVRDSTQACATVRAPAPPATDRVNISPNVPDSATYIEPTEQVTLSGRVDISNFPRPEDGGWGYNELARQLPAQRVRATSENRLETDSDSVAATANTTYSCPHGADSRSGSTCTHTYSGNANDTRSECEANGHNWSGGSCTDTHAANSNTTYSCPNSTYIRSGTTCSRTRYRCQGSTTWGSWNAAPPNCTYWTCPGGASGSGYRTTEPTCIGWKCQYADATQVNTVAAPTCEYRCSGGTGSRAYLDRDNGDGSDKRCFVEPTFVLSCQWQDGTVTNETVRFGTSVYCSGSKTLTGQTIGVPVCARITADHNATWTGSPQPGWTVNTAGVQRQLKIWGWSTTPVSDSGCARVVGKPTVKIFGGDITAGGAFINNGVCGASASSMIAGWPHAPNYNAAGTQFGAFSSGTITGFSSAMINANSAVAPRSLAFANFPASGGDTFGGSFGNMDCALDHYGDATPASLPTVGLSSINSNPTTPTASGSYRGSGTQIGHNPVIRNGQRIAVYVTGNVYISGNGITYQNRGAWQTVQDIPAFKLVVYGGNIYIAPSVTELSGTYVAQPNGAVGGNIYTCANNGSLIPDANLYNSCQNLLTVNGVFIAKKVHLQRTLGTAIRGETAERFNYLPEVWLAPWPQTNSASEIKYDAIISLPPVL